MSEDFTDPCRAILEARIGGDATDMTLRDWFAGQALIAVGAIAQEWAEDEDRDMLAKNIQITPQFIARQAYKMANAMLKERAKL